MASRLARQVVRRVRRAMAFRRLRRARRRADWTRP